MRPRLASKYIPLIATAAVLIVLYAAGCVSYRNFSSLRVIVNLFGDNAFLGVAAVGATFVILSGGIDLSVGSVVAFTSILIATLISKGMNPLAAIGIALAFGVLFGAGMGCLIQWFDLPPFLVTLAGLFLVRGAGFMVHPESLGIKHAFFQKTISQDLSWSLGQVTVPFTATSYLIVFFVGLFIAHWTRYGRYVYALGGEEHSAKLMGLPVARTKIVTYAVAGFCSAMAGVVYSFYTQSGDPTACVGLELDAIASVVIGGTLLTGGVGFMAGTMMGVLILGLIQTLVEFQGNLNTWWTRIVVGLLLLAFILLQNIISATSLRMSGAKRV